MSTPEKVTRKGHAARSAANKRLMAAHQEEFDRILREEREKLGLFPATKRATLAEQQAELDRLKKILEEKGIDY